MWLQSTILLLLFCIVWSSVSCDEHENEVISCFTNFFNKHKQEPSDFNVEAGHHSRMGRRPSMEDSYTMLPYPKFGVDNSMEKQSFFAVYDGHGGSQCADFCSENLHSVLASDPDLVSSPIKALRDTVGKIERRFLERGQGNPMYVVSGSTAIIAYLQGNKLFIANIGDSRAVMGKRSGSFQALSEDHKPGSTTERQRIESHHGAWVEGVSARDPVTREVSFLPRLFPGCIAVSRSIGDVAIKEECSNALSSEADIKAVTLTKKDDFLILACDGIWDVLSNSKAVRAVRGFKRSGDDAKAAAKKLVDLAYEKGSGDNISALIVFFKPVY